MNKQNFDLDWEFTESAGMLAMFFSQWQPVNLPHDLSITKVHNASFPVTLEVSGAGDLLAIGASNPNTEELYLGNQRRLW
jgi:hypothetical protein